MLKQTLRNQALRRLLLIGTSVLSGINRIIPKRDTILYYDGRSPTLRDNSEALHNYMQDHRYSKKYKIVLCIPNSREKEIDGSKNIGTITGVLTFLRARYVFYSFGDMRITPSKKQTVVNLFHGIAFKRIGKLCSDEQFQKEKLDSFTYVLATSEWFKPYVAAEFGVPEDRVLINGNCRSDYLQKKNYVLDLFYETTGTYKKRIIWMPTFRVSSNGRFNDSIDFASETGLPIVYTKEDLDLLNDYCRKNNVLIVIKAHNATVITAVGEYSNIRYMTDDEIEKKRIKLYEFIKDFDALITDYSSIFIDYLLINKPICFTVDDIDGYKKGRGFIIDDPLPYMPGNKAKTKNDLYQFLEELLSETDNYSNERKKINDLFNANKQSQCMHLLDLIGLKC